MSSITIRAATGSDLPQLAALRAAEWGTQSYWQQRLAAYLDGTGGPGSALPERIILVATRSHAASDAECEKSPNAANSEQSITGFAACHRTTRFDCDAELQWINVHAEQRGQGIASESLRKIAEWCVNNNIARVCVDVEPDNTAARALYQKRGARELDSHWLMWDDIREFRNR